jgi:hypothetical protein
MVIVILNSKTSAVEGLSDLEVNFSIFVIASIQAVAELYTNSEHNLIVEYVKLYNRNFIFAAYRIYKPLSGFLF